jgi:hypothetical protein
MIHNTTATQPPAASNILLAGTLLFLIYWIIPISHNQAFAESEIPDDRSDQYISVRGSIYKKNLAKLDEQGYGAYFKLRLSTSIYKYRSLDEFFFEDIEHFNSLGLRPTLDFEFSTPWQGIQFEPSIDIQATRRFDIEQSLLSGSAAATLRYRDQKKHGKFEAHTTLQYGTRYDQDGLNFDDYVRFKIGTSLNRGLDWKIGNHVMQMTPFASASYFLDDLEIGVSEEFSTARSVSNLAMRSKGSIYVFNCTQPKVPLNKS